MTSVSASSGASAPSGSVATLTPEGSKGRYGAVYLRSLCAQAGVGIHETPGDEDVLAVDCEITFSEGNVRVQVKCTSSLKIGGRSASWRLKDEWVRKWSDSLLPVYFVLVLVPRAAPDWLDHQPDGTLHRTAAFWRRVKPSELGTRIAVPKTQRLTASTLAAWRKDLIDSFTPSGGTP